MDYKSYGVPDLSYHGERAWFAQMEFNSRVLGVMYSGAYGRKADGSEDDSLYIAYNMHWEPHIFALPILKEGRVWKIAADTDQGFYQEGCEGELSDQKKISVVPRTVMILAARAPGGTENAAE